jgi:predicted lipoprotein
MRLMLALLIGLVATPALAQLHPTGRAVVTQAIEQVIRPGFDAFAVETKALETDTAALCATPSTEALEQARKQFGAVVRAWSRVELYRFGPLMSANRTERILFWPDRKGIALKQVQAILGTKDQGATDPVTLRGKSVAVQGLGALEYILFGTGAETLAAAEGEFRCRYGETIATLVSSVAAELSAEWSDPDGISARMIRPTVDNADYRDNAEVLQELIGVIAHGVEAIRDQRLLPFVGRDGEAPKPRSALFWRSNLTMPSVLANFDALRELLEKSAIWQYAPTEQFWIGEQIMAEFDAVAITGSGVTGTMEEAMADQSQVDRVIDLVTSSQVIGKLAGEDLPAALGLSVGFSSLDGD